VFAYLWFMMTPVQEILGIQYAYHSARAALVRINQLMDVGLEPEYPAKTNPFIDPILSRSKHAISPSAICLIHRFSKM